MNRAEQAVRSLTLAVMLASAGLLAEPSAALSQTLHYPATRTDTTVDDYFGTQIPAPYRWLEDTASAGVRAWVGAQNQLTSDYFDTLPLRSWIAERLRSTPGAEVVGIPKRSGRRVYYSHTSGPQAPVTVVARSDDGSEPIPVLDAAARWPDGSMQLINYRPSRDGRYMAYQLTNSATGEHSFRVLDLANGRDLPDSVVGVDRFSSVSWTRDGKGFVYDQPKAGAAAGNFTVDDDAYYHVVGRPQSEDILLHSQHDQPERGVAGGITASGRYLIINVWSTRQPINRLYYADIGDPMHPDLHAPLRPLLVKDDAQYIWLREVRDSLYILTTKDAANRRIIAVPFGRGPDPEPRVVVLEGPDPIQEASIVGERLAVLISHDAASHIKLFTLDGAPGDEVPLPGVGTAARLNGEREVSELFYQFTSPLQPTAWFRYDLERGTNEPVVDSSGGSLDPERYETREEFYTSKDGTRVPIFITARKGVELDGSHPTVLGVYGAFGLSVTTRAVPGSSAIPAWLELGGVFAQAAVRGGGDYGEAWHAAGMREHKQNGIDDVIAAAEYLSRKGYSAPAHLAIVSLRSGGLLVGAALTQRPDLFAAVYVRDGLLDPLRYDLTPQGSTWVSEFGSARDSTAFPHLYAYAPLQHVRAGVCYPAVLLDVSSGDPRATQAYTLVAGLQQAQPCGRPVLLREYGGAGAASPDGVERDAAAWSFLAKLTGMARVPRLGGARGGDDRSRKDW